MQAIGDGRGGEAPVGQDAAHHGAGAPDPTPPQQCQNTAGRSAEVARAPMLLAGGGTVDETVEFLLATGIGKAMFDNAEPAAAAAALDAVRSVLAEHHDGNGVRLGASAWLVTARRRLIGIGVLLSPTRLSGA